MAHGTPTLATGKICYLEIPAADVERSSRFYRDAFGWELRTRGDGAIAFDDAVKEVSGSWVTGRPPSAEPGIMVHIMVADLEAALAAIRAAGGEVLNENAAPGERVGHVRDPAGNVIGIYQQPGLAERERTVRPVPEHLHTVTPRLALSDGSAGIDFYKAAFDAKELGERYHMPDGTLVHAELLIGDSVVMVKDAQDDEFNALLCTYWPDVDAAWDRAVRAGAEVSTPSPTSSTANAAAASAIRSATSGCWPPGSRPSRRPNSPRGSRRRAGPASMSQRPSRWPGWRRQDRDQVRRVTIESGRLRLFRLGRTARALQASALVAL